MAKRREEEQPRLMDERDPLGERGAALVTVYVCRIAEAREVGDVLLARVADCFAKEARHLLDVGTEPAAVSAYCELASGALLATKLGVNRDDQLLIGPYGKPALAAPGPHFNISHSDNLAILGISDQELGVDVEPAPPSLERYALLTLGRALGMPHQRKAPPSPELRALAPTPREWARQWTRVEAILKGIGTGFGIEPRAYLPLMEGWQCAWDAVGEDVICCATQGEPRMELINFDVRAWARS